MRKFTIILTGLLFTAITVPAQRLLTIEEAVATALQNNYDIQLSKNDSLVAALNYSYRNAAFLPRLNGNLGTTWNNNSTKQILFDGTKRESSGLRSNNIAASLALNWTLFDGLKMFATRDKAAEYLKLGELGIKTQLVNTVANVITIYYNIVRQKQQLKAIEEQMAINEEQVKLAQYKLDIGSGAKPDVLQSKVDLNAQKAAQLSQQTLISQLKDQLSQVMNITAETIFEVSDTIPLNKDISLGEIQTGIDKSNPLLLTLKKNVDISNLTLKETKALGFPTVSLNSAYNFNRNKNQAVINSFSTLYNRSSGFNYGITATIPIFNNFNTKRLVQQAKLDIQYQELIYENQRSQINLSVLTAFKNYEQQKKELALEESNILLAKENVDIVFQTYKLGAATLLQLREAQRSLENAYTRLISARYNTKLAETQLLSLKGDLVK
ncbi:MAG: TolC family protein [Bacteroidetes bacterium]|nr:TolC family protein [Bacteroidota bacterium]MBS1633550.1 TolC family protein [Bacteroidota bacterium]